MNERIEAAIKRGHRTDARALKSEWRAALGAALAVAVTYYAGTKVGFALTFEPYPISVFWPTNALLFAALLLAPTRWWWLFILAALPAHLLAQFQAGVPLIMVLCWFVSNVTEALIGAALMRHLAPARGLNDLRAVIALCAAAVVAPFLSSFLDAAFVRLVGWGNVEYWPLWQARFVTNVLSTITFVPVVITLATLDPMQLPNLPRGRLVEGGALLGGLLAVSVVAFDSSIVAQDASPAFLYLPLPFLLWAALRFGPPLTAVGFTAMSFLVIWGAGHGRGPFLYAATHDNALPIQLFLLSVAVPMLFLAAVIQERRHAERKVRTSEERFSTAFRSSPDAMAISRASDGRIIEVNDRWLALLGYENDPLARERVAPLASYVEESDRAKLAAVTRDATRTRDVELTVRNCRGELRQTLVSVEGVELEGMACLITIVRDITDQRRAEREAREQRTQLTHLTRVASLSDLSGALTHDLSQPLTAILSNAQAAQRSLARNPPDLPEFSAILGDIAESAKRAGLLISRLRLLMKKGDETLVRTDLNQLVCEVLDFVRGEFATENITVTTNVSPDLPAVNADPIQLQQLVLNLISNACEAMRDHDRQERKLNVTTERGLDGSAHVIVTDAGPGIAADRLDLIFEPFYTTKERGLGLGLSICRTITRAHGGTLTVQNNDAGGASFRFVLPAAT